MKTVIRHLRRTALLDRHGGPTDGQLLDAFLGRWDETAFEALLRRHGPMVLAVCRRVLGDPHDTDDAFQEGTADSELADPAQNHFASRMN